MRLNYLKLASFCSLMALVGGRTSFAQGLPAGDTIIDQDNLVIRPSDPYSPADSHTGSVTIYEDGQVNVTGWANDFTNNGDVILGATLYNPIDNPKNGVLNVFNSGEKPPIQPIDPANPGAGDKPIPNPQVQMIINGEFVVRDGAVLEVNGLTDLANASPNHDTAKIVVQKDINISGGTINMKEATIEHDGVGDFGVSGGVFKLNNSNLINKTGDMNLLGGTFDLATNSSILQEGNGNINFQKTSVALNLTNPNDVGIAHIINSGTGNITIDESNIYLYGKSSLEAQNGNIDISNKSIVSLVNETSMSGDIINLNDAQIIMTDKANMTAGTINIVTGALSADSEAVINGNLTMSGGQAFFADKSVLNGGLNATDALLSVTGESKINGGASAVDLNNSRLFLSEKASLTSSGDLGLSGNSILQLTNSTKLDIGAINIADASFINAFNDAAIKGGVVTMTSGSINLSNNSLADFTNVSMGNGAIIYMADNAVMKSATTSLAGGSSMRIYNNSQLQGNVNATGGLIMLNDLAKIDGTVTMDGSASNATDFAKDSPKVIMSGNSVITGPVTIKDGFFSVGRGGNVTSGDITLQSGNYESTVDLSGKLAANVIGGGDKTNINYKIPGAFLQGNASNVNLNLFYDTRASQLVSGVVNNIQNVVVTNADLILDVGAGAGILNQSDKLTLSGNSTVTLEKDYTATTQTSVGTGSLLDLGSHTLTSGAVDFASGSKLHVAINSLTDYGKINANTITIDSTARLSLTIAQNLLAVGGTSSLSILDAATNITAGGMMVAENNMYDFVFNDATNAYDVTRTASATDVVRNFGGSKTSQSVANAWLNGPAFATNSTAADISAQLNDMAQFNGLGYVDTLDILAPDVDLPVQVMAVENINKVFSAIGSRLSGGLAFGQTGQASGKGFAENSIWVQGLYDTAELEKTENMRGFDADTYGGVMGLERRNRFGTKIGIGYAYQQSDIDSRMRTMTADSHTGFVYGEYKPKNWYVNAISAYTVSSYDEEKSILRENVEASFDVNSYSAQVNTGYEVDWFTPEIGVRYVSVSRDGYTDSIEQKVGKLDADVFTGLAGIKFSPSYRASSGLFVKPQLAIRATYDLSREDELLSVVSLPNGSSYDVTSENLDKFGIEVGASITLSLNQALEMSLGYEGRFRKDYTDHAGMAGLKLRF